MPLLSAFFGRNLGEPGKKLLDLMSCTGQLFKCTSAVTTAKLSISGVDVAPAVVRVLDQGGDFRADIEHQLIALFVLMKLNMPLPPVAEPVLRYWVTMP